jgi:hypothetical protein
MSCRTLKRRLQKPKSSLTVEAEHALCNQPLCLYGYLWMKPDFVDDECGKFSFFVTDTILLRQQTPLRWFFTSKQEKGKILAKTKKHLQIHRILKEFHSEPQNPIVAIFAFTEEENECHHRLVVEYLDQTSLEQLLSGGEFPDYSILQRFIPTRSGSGNNAIIRCVYTPTSLSIRKCVNRHALHDGTRSLVERTVTFEDENAANRASKCSILT